MAREAVSVIAAEDQQLVRRLLLDLGPADWLGILERVPAILMSHHSRRFAAEIIRLNHERLLNALDIR